MIKLKLSAHFWLHEFTFSEAAARLGREIEPSQQEIENLRRLCVTILEPLRVDMGRSITVSSGLRPEWLNTLIGGSKTSQHMTGEAADIIMQGRSPAQVCRRIIEMKLPYQQLIFEFGRWTHVSIAQGPPKAQVLTARVGSEGRTEYLNGILEA